MKVKEQKRIQASGGDAEYVRRWVELLKSPACLLWYVGKSERRYKFDKFGELLTECPSLQCHCVCDQCREGVDKSEFSSMSLDEIEDALSAPLTGTIIKERGTGIARVYCEMCGATWDVFSLCMVDRKIDRDAAVRYVVEGFTNEAPKIVNAFNAAFGLHPSPEIVLPSASAADVSGADVSK